MSSCAMCGSRAHSTEIHQENLRRGRLESPIWRDSVVASNKKHKTGVPHTESHNQAIGDGLLKTYQGNPELHEKLSVARRRTWANRTEADKDALFAKSSATQKGRSFTPTHLANLRKANSRPRTEEHKYKLGLAHVGGTGKAKTPARERERVRKIRAKQLGRPKNFARNEFWYEGQHGRVRMRSSWELLFAHWCDKVKLPWQYEPRFFTIGKGSWLGRTYTPDFYLPSLGVYVEIKGWLPKAQEAKLKRFREKYSDVPWIMIQGYQELQFASALAFLED